MARPPLLRFRRKFRTLFLTTPLRETNRLCHHSDEPQMRFPASVRPVTYILYDLSCSLSHLLPIPPTQIDSYARRLAAAPLRLAAVLAELEAEAVDHRLAAVAGLAVVADHVVAAVGAGGGMAQVEKLVER